MRTQKLSKISVRPPLRGLFLFQTLNQFLLVTIGIAVVWFIVQSIPGLSEGAKAGASTGIIFAAITWLVLTLPAEFEWKLAGPSSRVYAREQLLRWFADLGYTREVSHGRFSLDAPDWLRGDTNVVSVESADIALKVAGPWIVIRHIRRLAGSQAFS